jgi:hypothetical protein
MVHKSKSISVLAAFLLIFLLTNTIVFAAPMPPRPVVNHQTRQCAVIVTGDECGDVVLPSGWKYMDEAAGEQCPNGYATIDLNPDWTHFKVTHCCSEGHSGSSGDCQDVVIQQSKRHCAFVEDIQACTALPKGWETWGENCPTGFEWVDQLACAVSSTSVSTPPSKLEPTSTTPKNDSTGSGGKIATSEPTEQSRVPNPLLPCASVVMPLAGLVGGGVLLKRK